MNFSPVCLCVCVIQEEVRTHTERRAPLEKELAAANSTVAILQTEKAKLQQDVSESKKEQDDLLMLLADQDQKILALKQKLKDLGEPVNTSASFTAPVTYCCPCAAPLLHHCCFFAAFMLFLLLQTASVLPVLPLFFAYVSCVLCFDFTDSMLPIFCLCYDSCCLWALPQCWLNASSLIFKCFAASVLVPLCLCFAGSASVLPVCHAIAAFVLPFAPSVTCHCCLCAAFCHLCHCCLCLVYISKV